MFTFVWEREFGSAPAGIGRCPFGADQLLRRIEARCRARIRSGGSGYGLVHLFRELHRLLTWHLAVDCTTTVSEIRIDPLLEGMQLVPSVQARSLTTRSSMKDRVAERTHA
jgi:hypothetical protein